mmetsp:Transcript_38294/g.113846  ORF Transcript_38294/g.113846 Transcript_38294/m.113846 type:complete len:203 (+) Transcript_38294:160-768(+)
MRSASPTGPTSTSMAAGGTPSATCCPRPRYRSSHVISLPRTLRTRVTSGRSSCARWTAMVMASQMASSLGTATAPGASACPTRRLQLATQASTSGTFHSTAFRSRPTSCNAPCPPRGMCTDCSARQWRRAPSFSPITRRGERWVCRSSRAPSLSRIIRRQERRPRPSPGGSFSTCSRTCASLRLPHFGQQPRRSRTAQPRRC